jgi:hypothetical protein
MQKPVWRIETENKQGMEAVYIPDVLPDVVLLSHSADVYAYQTTRTKAAKYRRVECDWCVNGYELTGISTCDICRKCNGRGAYWEKI